MSHARKPVATTFKPFPTTSKQILPRNFIIELTYASEVPVIQMFKILETQFMRVMRKVDCVNVPRHLFPEWQSVIVTHAQILGRKTAARSHLFGIGRFPINHVPYPIRRCHFQFADYVLNWYSWKEEKRKLFSLF